MVATVWDIQDFQSTLDPQKRASRHQIVDSVRRLLKRNEAGRNGILLPSLKRMSEVFHCSYRDVQEAFQDLEPNGYQAIFPGLYGHVSLFKTNLLN